MFLKYRMLWVKPNLIRKYVMMGISLILLFILLYFFRTNNINNIFQLTGDYQSNPAMILREELPSVFSSKDGKDSDIQETGWENFFYFMAKSLTGVNTREPFSILCSELNMSPVEAAAGILSAAAPVEEEGGEEDFYLPEDNKEELDEWYVIPEEEIPPVQLNGEPMVLIYNTHNAESYKPTQGVSKMDGKNGGVAAVSKTVTGLLASKYSIKTEYSEAIHDYPDWTKSYVNSMHTVKNYLKKYQKLQAVIDIHRDAGLQTRGDTLVKINGMQCAKVMIVIGAEHPRWKQNLAFAQKIESKANQLYPGLIKSIRLRKDRRYNQNLHPRAILLEFGSDLNKQEDAVNSAKLMADVLAAVLKSN